MTYFGQRNNNKHVKYVHGGGVHQSLKLSINSSTNTRHVSETIGHGLRQRSE